MYLKMDVGVYIKIHVRFWSYKSKENGNMVFAYANTYFLATLYRS